MPKRQKVKFDYLITGTGFADPPKKFKRFSLKRFIKFTA